MVKLLISINKNRSESVDLDLEFSRTKCSKKTTHTLAHVFCDLKRVLARHDSAVVVCAVRKSKNVDVKN